MLQGSIECEELSVLLADLGVHASRETVEAAVAALDVDGSGAIEMDEFMAFLRYVLLAYMQLSACL
jgi:Ca2+-binding EF-hand superfamily protein